jgi:pimeloyl-ACP methyl ester carboxylesterase
MVTPDSYNDDAPFLPYGPLLNGFSILIPNTRGRGGYGRDFEAAIRERKDYVDGPLEDILGGVAYATKTLGTPRSRVALAGFSYGGILTAYAASHTHTFRAALAMEGVVDFYSRALLEYGGPNQQAANANMGFGNPYDVDDKERLLAQSPLRSIDALQTPVLLGVEKKPWPNRLSKILQSVMPVVRHQWNLRSIRELLIRSSNQRFASIAHGVS